MNLKNQTLQKFRNLIINTGTSLTLDFEIIIFFNDLGFKDDGDKILFDRETFIDEKLQEINGTSKMDQCIKLFFAPINFAGRIKELDSHIFAFNEYLIFDQWEVVRNNADITCQKLDSINLPATTESNNKEGFLIQEINDLNLSDFPLDYSLTSVIEYRLKEMQICFHAGAYLSVIILAGSTLEGILFGIAAQNAEVFNRATSAPKNKEQNVKQFNEWSLINFIDVAKEVDLLKHDAHKLSHAIREFRNYVHPFEQMKDRFHPTIDIAKMYLQLCIVVIQQISDNMGVLKKSTKQ